MKLLKYGMLVFVGLMSACVSGPEVITYAKPPKPRVAIEDLCLEKMNTNQNLPVDITIRRAYFEACVGNKRQDDSNAVAEAIAKEEAHRARIQAQLEAGEKIGKAISGAGRNDYARPKSVRCTSNNYLGDTTYTDCQEQ